MYRWFKHRYKNWGEKAHKTEQSRAKENRRKRTEPSPIDRAQPADRSARISKIRTIKHNDRKSIAEYEPIDRLSHTSFTARAPIDRGIRVDRSGAHWWPRQSHCRSIPGINWLIGKSSWCSTASFSGSLRLWISTEIRSKHVLYKYNTVWTKRITLERKTQILTKKLKKKKNKLLHGEEDSRKLSKTSWLRVYSNPLFFISSFLTFLVMNMNSIVYIDLLLAMRG